MYPYHNKIKQRIRAGELLDYTFVQDYPRIGECLLLSFSTPPYLRPVRPCRYGEYTHILEGWSRAQGRQRRDRA